MRKLIIIFLCGITLLLVAYAGYQGYRVTKKNRLVNMAREFMEQSDMQNALLSVDQVLMSDPNNLEALRMKAVLAEASRSPVALLLRSQILELQPESTEDRLALVQTALMMQDYATATNALNGVAAEDRDSVAYHNLAGTVAAAGNRLQEAGHHYQEAARLNPESANSLLNLAVVRLQSTNEPVLAEARQLLLSLTTNPTNASVRSKALRELTGDALRSDRKEDALALTRRLVGETNSAFGDRILQLEVLNLTTDPSFPEELAEAQSLASTNSARIYQLANWLIGRQAPGEALDWMRKLPEETQTSQPTTLLIAQCLLQLGNWQELHTWLEPQNWGQLDFMRLALDSRALRELGLADSSTAVWGRAITSAEVQKQRLVTLLQFAAAWNWLTESEELLWNIVNRHPEEQWANIALVQRLYQGGRTRSLMQLFSQQLKQNASDDSARNNLAMTALLLDAKEMKPYELARDVFQRSPTNAAFVSTYAFSLHLQEQNNEAMKIMQQLDSKQLEDPSVAGYYGIILQASGRTNLARDYFQHAASAPLLPEESRLFNQARTGL